MKVIFMDTRAFSMARNMRCNGLGSVSLFLVAAGFALTSPVLARETDDAFLSSRVLSVLTQDVAYLRPMPRPADQAVTPVVSRNNTATPLQVMAPAPLDRSRIRQSWAIGVFR
jgi:hypothetical protein